MPVFEIQGPDGKVYEVDAPDQQAAISAFESYSSQAPEPIEEQGMVTGTVDALTDGMSFGFGDNITAFEAGLLGRTPDGGWFDYSKSFGERYDDALQAERKQNDQFYKDNPVVANTANIAGAVAMPFAAAKSGATLLKGGMSAPKATGLGALEGSAYGALHGAGAADGEDVAENAIQGGTIGGALGGPMSGLSQLFVNKLANRGAQSFNSLDDLKAAKQAAYQRVDDIGVQYKPEAVDDLLSAMKTENDAAMIDPILHDKASRVFDRVSDHIGGQPASLTKLDQMRQYTRNNTAADDANRYFGQKMVRNIDEFVDAAGPEQVLAGNAQAGSEALQEARQLHGRMAKFEDVQNAIEFAKARAVSTNSGANTGNAIRQNVRRLWEQSQKPGKAKGRYTQSEMEAMRRVFEGTTAQNMVRGTGKQLGGALGKLTGYGGAAHTGNSALMALPAIGSASRGIDEAMTNASSNTLLSEILQGGAKQTARQPATLNALQKLMINQMAATP